MCSRRYTNLELHSQLITHYFMSQAHSKGIAHGDVRPTNLVWIEVKSKPLLVDWGLAIKLKSVKPMGGVHGQMDFVSNRIIKAICNGEAYSYGPLDDLAGLGYTLQYLLTGCLPWGPCRMTSVLKVHEARLKYKAKIHPTVQEFIARVDASSDGELPYEELKDIVKTAQQECQPSKKKARRLAKRRGHQG